MKIKSQRDFVSGIMLIEVISGRPRDLIYRVVGERAVRQRGRVGPSA